VLCETSSDGASLFCSEVERKVFLSLVEETELCTLVGVDDGEDLGDRFADIVAISQKKISIWFQGSIRTSKGGKHMNN
jgi:hypothetical protein